MTVLYAALVLGAAATGGYRLYYRAKQLIAYSAPQLSALSFPTALFSGNEQVAAKPDVVQPSIPLNVKNQPVALQKPLNVLLLGTDARSDDRGLPRTDTLIFLTLDRQSSIAGLLSLPRDLWVPVPEINRTVKLNTVYQLGEQEKFPGGGMTLVMNTVSNFVGQPIDYYVRVNFQGFVRLIDLIDGIDIMVPKVIHDENYPTPDYGVETFHLEAGPQHLDGETALKYARTRNVDDDYGRARRQQEVIRAVLDKVLRANMIPILLPKLAPLVYTMRSSIDTNIPMAVQLDLATYLLNFSPTEIRQDVLDKRYGEERYSQDGAWILVPDPVKVRVALEKFFRPVDKTAQNAATPTGVDPHWVRIEILNGTGEQGVAARTRAFLEKQGWHIVAIGDADRGDYGETILVDYGVPQLVLDKVCADLHLVSPPARLKGLNTTTPVDLRIVVGRDILSIIQ